MKPSSRTAEYIVAVASFAAAVVFAFVSLAISNDHEVAAGNCTVVAQFLILTASIFGIDYKLNTYGHTNPRGTQQQSPKHRVQSQEQLEGSTTPES